MTFRFKHLLIAFVVGFLLAWVIKPVPVPVVFSNSTDSTTTITPKQIEIPHAPIVAPVLRGKPLPGKTFVIHDSCTEDRLIAQPWVVDTTLGAHDTIHFLVIPCSRTVVDFRVASRPDTVTVYDTTIKVVTKIVSIQEPSHWLDLSGGYAPLTKDYRAEARIYATFGALQLGVMPEFRSSTGFMPWVVVTFHVY